MSVWLCLPSARPWTEIALRMQRWHEQGYKIAMVRDEEDVTIRAAVDLMIVANRYWGKYPGYAVSMNHLVLSALTWDHACQWVVVAGDDIDPEPHLSAAAIAGQCSGYFANEAMKSTHFDTEHEEGLIAQLQRAKTFGVMQPTGDRWGDAQGAYIDRVAGSPWIGRDFAERMYQGLGPYWPEYTHMGVDEELQYVATLQGVFLQRPDLTHFHDHWGRPRPGEHIGLGSRMPAFLENANSAREWTRYKRIFYQRHKAGFPGHTPLEAD